MEQITHQEVFAVGKNVIEQDCGTVMCPARAAGFEPDIDNEWSPTMVHEYDAILRDRYQDGKHIDFVVDESKAKEAWLDALITFKEGSYPWNFGRKVAKKLGWL